jgi:hypothetical protein
MNRESLSESSIKWCALLLFAVTPIALSRIVISFGGPQPTFYSEKPPLLQKRTNVDTVVIGDSRVLRLDESVFQERGWNYFNMGLPGTSPEDAAMQLEYVLLRRPIKRVLIGACLEGMSETFPFQFSGCLGTPAFQDPKVVSFATVTSPADGDDPHQATSPSWLELPKFLLPIGQASTAMHGRLISMGLEQKPAWYLANGNMDYRDVERSIREGIYDFEKNRNPHTYFDRPEDAPGLLKNGTLPRYLTRLYQKMLDELRSRHIPTVVYETGRSPGLETLYASNKTLSDLQAKWRAFFRSEAHDGVEFLDIAQTRDCYDDNDFIDAVHFVGGTETRLARRLADRLAQLEARMSLRKTSAQ